MKRDIDNEYEYIIPGKHYKRERSQSEMNGLFTIGMLGGTGAFLAADSLLEIDHHLKSANEKFAEKFLSDED